MHLFGRIFSALVGRRPAFLQVAAICLRETSGRKEVLLVRSLDTGRLIVPKGWPMRGRSLAEAALQEAWEEAGVKGTVCADSVGQFHYHKKRRGGLVQRIEVHCHLVQVSTLAQTYPEAGRRKRQWVPLAEAAGRVREKELQAILGKLAIEALN